MLVAGDAVDAGPGASALLGLDQDPEEGWVSGLAEPGRDVIWLFAESCWWGRNPTSETGIVVPRQGQELGLQQGREMVAGIWGLMLRLGVSLHMDCEVCWVGCNRWEWELEQGQWERCVPLQGRVVGCERCCCC